MNEIGEKYLPLGTVVLLKGATKRVMITGFASKSPDTGEKVFDYSGCIYPEGFFDYNKVCVFDHEQIDEIFQKGLDDEENKAFMVRFKEEIAKLEKEENK